MASSSGSLNPFAFPGEPDFQPPQSTTSPIVNHTQRHGNHPSSLHATQRHQEWGWNSSTAAAPASSTIISSDTIVETSEAFSSANTIIIEGSAKLFHLTSSIREPELSNAFRTTYRIERSSLHSNGLIEMKIINCSDGVLLWSSSLKSLHGARVGSFCLFLTSSNFVSTRDVTDVKPIMPSKKSLELENKQQRMAPILLSFSSTGELERLERCMVTFAPTAFCPSVQDLAVSAKDYRRTSHNWCHLDNSDVTTVQTYFQYYGKMTNQMNMLQDSVRTELYRQAIFSNAADFRGKRVMDVGAGSGILSFFSAQTGASVVYAVEASSMATTIATLAEANIEYGCRLRVVNRTVEALDLDRDLDGYKVDVLVSEPIGTFLFNERMIESYLFARDAFLKPGGRMYPNRCRLFLAPFSDPVLYNDISTRCTFWTNQDFYGLNLSSVVERAIEEQLRQPVVDYIDPNAIVCQMWHQEDFDLEKVDREFLANMEFRFNFPITTACLVHGIAGWFDVLFEGSERHVGFSTAPWTAPTHWYQIRFLLKHPIAANPGQTVSGTLRMAGNAQQSYFITVQANLEGTNVCSESTVVDLKDPDYRYYTNPTASYIPPPPSQHQSTTSNTKIRSTMSVSSTNGS